MDHPLPMDPPIQKVPLDSMVRLDPFDSMDQMDSLIGSIGSTKFEKYQTHFLHLYIPVNFTFSYLFCGFAGPYFIWPVTSRFLFDFAGPDLIV